MRKFKFSFGVMIAMMVLLPYAYITFLGRLYMVEGDILRAGFYALGVIVVVAVCVYILVNAKLTKSREAGIASQIVIGLVILSVFIFVAGRPFTSFLEVAGNRAETKAQIDSIKLSVQNLDACYNQYVEKRLNEYRQNLEESQQPMPNEVRNSASITSRPMSSSIAQNNDLKVRSLQRRLCPSSLASCQQQRKEWVDGIADMSIWNIRLPSNLNVLGDCVSEWTNEYMEISSIVYEDETSTSFEYDVFNNSIDKLMRKFTNPGYSLWAIFVAVLAALVMLLPYWLAKPVEMRKSGEIIWKPQIKH